MYLFKNNIVKIFIISFIFVILIFYNNFLTSTSDAANENDDVYQQLNMFGEVYERVRREYVEEVTNKELIEAAIEGMLQSLDPHSSFMNADSFKDMQVQTKGEFGGLGIEVSMEEGLVKVVSPIDDTPAFHAGIQAGDFIIEIDGESVLGMSLGDAVDKMRGKINTEIVITILRENKEPFEVKIIRDKIKIQSVRARKEGNVAYLRITSFNEKTKTGLLENMKKLKDQIGENITGVILDLRNNPGGLLEQAIAVSDAFLNQGEIVSTRGRISRGQQRFNATKGDISDGLPIVVLINSGSASASEIVAGALQDHKRAIIMGTTSFGKGSVQTIIPIQKHSAMRLTTARYYTPSGRSIQATGIIPDIIVKQSKIEELKSFSERRESDLRGHLDNPSNLKNDNSDTTETADNEDDKDNFVDYQLNRALDLLEGISFYNKDHV
ncbi:MAG: putative CtpA-like serine protease [Alphaproteobacteria bacterium MarineAlpha9_Bin1]|nr:MAG: putative CtpA-like serine protease [Alphaproteobacteria bacterium MarineAlpha9_Bin1]